MKRHFLFLIASVGAAFGAAAKYPFPFTRDYLYGVRGSSVADPESEIQGTYDDWLLKYYTECSDGQRARIKWVDPKAAGAGCSADGSCTVSEGIGYGMLILVYMDNPKNQTQTKFDKLWKYYNSFLDKNKLMKWKIDGCNSAKDDGAATDAEMDVALALAMAYKQWGAQSYLDDAKKLLGNVWASEVDQGQKILKPGDLWSDPYNPSYFATGALRVFQDVDPTHDWKSIADGSLALAIKNQNSTTGLASDWCSSSGSSVDKNGSGTGKFGYDAARTPWRITLDYLWFGTPAAKTSSAKIATWIRSKTNNSPVRVRAEYNQDGTTTVANWTNPLYLGALIVPGMVDAANQKWVNDGEMVMTGIAGENYYNSSWKILYELTLTGSLQNYWGKLSGLDKKGKKQPHGWSVSSKANSILITLPAAVKGSAEILDANGKRQQFAQGIGSIELNRPAMQGVYFVSIRTSDDQFVIPVVSN